MSKVVYPYDRPLRVDGLNERMKAFKMFQDYLRMGPERSQSKLAQKYAEENGGDPKTYRARISYLSPKYFWVDRAQEHDIQVGKKEEEFIIKERIKARRKLLKAGWGLLDTGTAEMDKIRTLQKAMESGKEKQKLLLSPKLIPQFIKIGADVLGIPLNLKDVENVFNLNINQQIVTIQLGDKEQAMTVDEASEAINMFFRYLEEHGEVGKFYGWYKANSEEYEVVD